MGIEAFAVQLENDARTIAFSHLAAKRNDQGGEIGKNDAGKGWPGKDSAQGFCMFGFHWLRIARLARSAINT